MRLTFCGVRGSTPAPGHEFAGVGGHTSCVAVARDGASAPTLVIDAGTGLRRVSALLGGEAFRGTILLTHLHWDHVQGLPFFRSGDRHDATVRVLVPEQGRDPLALLAAAMSPPHFPITPDQMRGDWQFDTLAEGLHEIEGFRVTAMDVPHSAGRTFGLRVSAGGRSFAYLSDHAPHDLGGGPHGLGEYHPAAVELAAGVDLLIHDATLTRDELASRAHLGHAVAEYAAHLAERAGARRVLLFHHDPDRTDDAVRAVCHDVRAASPSTCVDVASEGLEVDL
jgi:phosphoribosyl 1,2-cyclic phosphodiesterase